MCARNHVGLMLVFLPISSVSFLRIRQNNVPSNHPEVLFKPLAACVPESMKTLSSVLRFLNMCISLFSTLTCLKDNAAPSPNLSP